MGTTDAVESIQLDVNLPVWLSLNSQELPVDIVGGLWCLAGGISHAPGHVDGIGPAGELVWSFLGDVSTNGINQDRVVFLPSSGKRIDFFQISTGPLERHLGIEITPMEASYPHFAPLLKIYVDGWDVC